MTAAPHAALFSIQKSPIKSGIKTQLHLRYTLRQVEFKKAPSNRGLRPILLLLLIKVVAIQKSPIKSGIKTSTSRAADTKISNSKKPHQIGD